jgi:hypothetical protein
MLKKNLLETLDLYQDMLLTELNSLLLLMLKKLLKKLIDFSNVLINSIIENIPILKIMKEEKQECYKEFLIDGIIIILSSMEN